MKDEVESDWTLAWRGAEALALSCWTRDPQRLRDESSARLLELLLELTALERRLVVHGWVVLPGALHVVAGRPRPSEPPPSASWPLALGRVKGLHARCDNRRLGLTGSVWRSGARLRPLRPGQARPAVSRLREAPVRAGLCERPGDWLFGSLRRRLDGPAAAWLRDPA